jgi:hypothetical protein
MGLHPRNETSVMDLYAPNVMIDHKCPPYPGKWELRYQFYAIGFPPLCVEVGLRFDTFSHATARMLRQYTATTFPASG